MSRMDMRLAVVGLLVFCGAANAGVLGAADMPYDFGDGYKLQSLVGGKSSQTWDVNANVKDNGVKKVGTIDFEYQLYKGTHGAVGGASDSGTAGCWANFNVNLPNNVQLANGWKFTYFQIVRASTNAGVQPWNAQAGDWFMDTGSSTTDPRYGGLDAATQSFSDYPDRPLNADEYWNAEVALGLVNMTAKKAELIGSAYWGFRIDKAAGTVKNNPGDVFASPAFWGGATQTMKDTFLKDWPGVADFSNWTLVSDGQGLVMVPAPATLAAVAGILFGASRRRRAAAI